LKAEAFKTLRKYSKFGRKSQAQEEECQQPSGKLKRRRYGLLKFTSRHIGEHRRGNKSKPSDLERGPTIVGSGRTHGGDPHISENRVPGDQR
jgi:hypothetical protein